MGETAKSFGKETTPISSEITVSRINKESFLERRNLRKIFDDPKTNRHTIEINDNEPKTKEEKDEEFRTWLRDYTVYGIYKEVNGRRKLISAAFFEPYTEDPPDPNEKPEDHSETLDEMVNLGIIPNSIVPRIENTNTVNFERTYVASIFMPEGVSVEELSTGFREILQTFIKENQLPENTLILFFRLHKQNQSTAEKSDYITPSKYKEELEEEERILRGAGFANWADIERGDVGVSTFYIYKK